MADFKLFGGDSGDPATVSTTGPGLDWNRVQAEHSRSLVPPLDHPCSLLPCNIVNSASRPDQSDFLVDNAAYGVLRPLAIAGAIAASRRPPGSSWPGGLLAGVGTMFADQAIDQNLFPDVKRGPISTIADAASIGCFFLPQNRFMQTAEAVGIHLAGKTLEKLTQKS